MKSESQMQLEEVNFLKEQMRNVSESDAFKSFEGLTSCIQSNKNNGANFEEKINQAVESILAKQISLLQDNVTTNATLGSSIELIYNPSLEYTGGVKETELQKE